MQINYAEKTLEFVLQRDPIFQRAEIIADVKISCRLRAAEDSFFHKLKKMESKEGIQPDEIRDA